MKNQKYVIALLINILICYAQGGFAQEPDTTQSQTRFYRTLLQLDSSKANLVSNIQNGYKLTLNGIMADTSLRGVRRERKIQQLMNSRNLQLKKLLNDNQLSKLLSPSERLSDTTKKN